MDLKMALSVEAAPDRTAQGVGFILASVVTMAFADALVKLMSADLTIWQIFAARSLIGPHSSPPSCLQPV